MKKYVKPIAVDLGTPMNIAEGVCYGNGSTAKTSYGNHCIATGHTASGGICTGGSAVYGCISKGLIPYAATCYTGVTQGRNQ